MLRQRLPETLPTAVLRVVPVVAELREKMSDQPATGVKQEDPQYGGIGGNHGVRQQHEGLTRNRCRALCYSTSAAKDSDTSDR